MTLEALVLAVVSALRPATSQAAVFALLKAPAAGRSLIAFTVAGLVASVGIGLVVVLGFDGARVAVGQSTFGAVFDLVAGVAALGFAAGIQRGRVGRPRPASGPRRGSGIADRLRQPSALTAAAAGVATHMPGLIYLVALNSIAAGQPSAAAALVQVGIYNLLWFAVPLAALVLTIRSPGAAEAYLDRATAVLRRHQETVLIALFGTLGTYLTVKGIVSLV